MNRNSSNLKFWLRKKKLLYLIVSFILGTVFINYSNVSFSHSIPSFKDDYNYLNLQWNSKKVKKIADLLDVSLPSKYINKINDNQISKYWQGKNFLKKKVKGFITNLDYSTKKTKLENSFELDISCNDLQYDHPLYFNVQDRNQTDTLIKIRREILAWDNEISSKVQDANLEKGLSEADIVKKHWFEFGHMSVWFEQENCFLTYSRVIYTKGPKNLPIISLIRATAYDKDWNELVGKKIPYDDIIMPDELNTELDILDKQLDLDGCKDFKQSSKEYSECSNRQLQSMLKNKQTKEKILDKYFVTYPKVLDFEFKLIGGLAGPEDPHVILRTTLQGKQEPIIIYNLDNGKNRRIYAVLPYRRNPKPVEFTLNEGKGWKLNKAEKNWSPFFLSHHDNGYSQLSNGYIHFVYSYIPLCILSCSLDDGKCDEVFSGETIGLSQDNKDSSLRGGTQFVPLPDILPGVEGKNIWIAFAKTHTTNCGCGTHFYRPVLVVMIESFGVYHLELVSPGIDFSIEPLNFAGNGKFCDLKNVLTPNSIASWDLVSKDNLKNSFEDYLTLSVSEADSISRVVIIRGMLDYILNIYKKKNIKKTFEVNERANDLIFKNRMCVVDYAAKMCKEYGQSHKKKENKKD